jgi:hypothetical protein
VLVLNKNDPDYIKNLIALQQQTKSKKKVPPPSKLAAIANAQFKEPLPLTPKITVPQILAPVEIAPTPAALKTPPAAPV